MIVYLARKNIGFPDRDSQQHPLLLKTLVDRGPSQNNITLFKINCFNLPVLA